jgi:hypothetical protein
LISANDSELSVSIATIFMCCILLVSMLRRRLIWQLVQEYVNGGTTEFLLGKKTHFARHSWLEKNAIGTPSMYEKYTGTSFKERQNAGTTALNMFTDLIDTSSFSVPCNSLKVPFYIIICYITYPFVLKKYILNNKRDC